MLTSHLASIALACGGVVLLLGLVWLARAPHAEGRRLRPRKRSDGVVSAILVLDGVALMAIGALAGTGGDEPPGRDGGPARAGATRGDGDPPGSRAGGEPPGLVPVPLPEPAEPPVPRRSRAFLTARLAGDGTSGQADDDGHGGVRLDVRPAGRHLCFDMAVDEGIAGSIASAYVFRTATPGALPHLTLVVPDDKPARRRRGCAAEPPSEALRAVVDAPERFVVRISNEAYPDGAIAGELAPCRSPCRTRAPDLLP